MKLDDQELKPPPMPKLQKVTLTLSSWVGISPGAQHTYARLTYYTDKRDLVHHEIYRTLDTKAAKLWNEQQEESDTLFTKKRAGDACTAFDTKEQAIEAGKRNAAALFKGDYVLFLGDFSTMSAHPIVTWPTVFDKIVARMNELAKEWDAIGGYEGNEKRADAIDKEWIRLHDRLFPT